MIDAPFIERMRKRLGEIEAGMTGLASGGAQKPAFRDAVREHVRLKRIIEKAEIYARMLREIEEARALAADASADGELRAMAAAELKELEARAPAANKDAMLAMLPPDPNDSRNTIVEIRAGTGGDEAALFAGDLCRMYTRYAENRGWKARVLDAKPSEVGGYKEVILSVEGENVYRSLQFEAGTHRVQRVPVTEAQGRIHTSAATIAVLPEAEAVDEIEIKPDDIRIEYCRASGAGGQHVNKTDSACRIVHIPSGIAVESQAERSQRQNRENAMRQLCARLLDIKQSEDREKTGAARRAQIGSGDRSERIRTYNFPQNRLTDHRINLTIYSLDKIIEGDLDAVLTALYDNHVSARLEKEAVFSDPSAQRS